jgi:hypothetical protein
MLKTRAQRGWYKALWSRRVVLALVGLALLDVPFVRSARAGGAVAAFTVFVTIEEAQAGEFTINPALNEAFPGEGASGGAGTSKLRMGRNGTLLLKAPLKWPQAYDAAVSASDLSTVWTGKTRDIHILLAPQIAPPFAGGTACTQLTLDCSNPAPPICEDPKADPAIFEGASLFVTTAKGMASTSLDKVQFQGDVLCKPAPKGDFIAWLLPKSGDPAAEVTVHDSAPKGVVSCTAPNDLINSTDYDVLIVSYAQSGVGKVDGCDLSNASYAAPGSCLPKAKGRSERSALLPTNEPIDVVVVFPGTYHSKVSATGNVQASNPVVQGPSLPRTPGAAAGGGGPPPPPNCAVQRWHLGPRAAGPAVVTTSLTTPAGEDVKGSAYTIELAIETKYVGAIRVGLGMSFASFGSGTWGGSRSYGVRQEPDGRSIVHQDSEPFGNYEIVAGYSAFIINTDGDVGSRPASHLTDLGVSFFAGLGVVSVSSTGTVNGLTSAYVGPEFSLGGVAIQGLVGVRRDTVPADGYPVGTYVPASFSLPTQNEYYFAAGVAVSVTSDIFKIAGWSVP